MVTLGAVPDSFSCGKGASYNEGAVPRSEDLEENELGTAALYMGLRLSTRRLLELPARGAG